ncbi:MAG: Mrp/NBP35 family ATP-binding protein [Bacteroidales bacterium]|nr:Mrp/NBP35 family ATP-binding protein [Bacteroidales bacterium]
MSAITKTMIEMALSHVDDPDLGQSLTQLGMIENIEIENARGDAGAPKVSFDLVLTTPACPMKSKMKEDCINAIHEYVDRNAEVTVNLTSRKVEQPKPEEMFPNLKNTILVASGKGGVGKSTVAVNLAVALAKTGAKVGLIDADIYGPSIPIMFNITENDIYGEKHGDKTYMSPIMKYNVKLMSVGFLVDPDKAMVWRGPMASGAVKQLLTETWWDEIDYLVVDMPPGTGDIQLTIAQTLPVTGAIIVSTPQQVALADVVRGVEMFQNPNINIPVLGFVENMAWFTPAELPNNKYYIFGKEGCSKLSKEMGIPLLGQIPLVQSIAESGDSGKPVALGNGERRTENGERSPESEAFDLLAENTIREICKLKGVNKK